MPKIYFTAAEGPILQKLREVIGSMCDKLGLDLFPVVTPAEDFNARQMIIENAAFVIADITAEKSGDLFRLAYEIGYAKRAQKSIILIGQTQKAAMPALGQPGLLNYDLQDWDGFANKMLAVIVALCRKEHLKCNTFPNMPEVKEDVKLPVLAKTSLQIENYVALGDTLVDQSFYEQAYQEYGRAIVHLGQSAFKSHHCYIFAKRAYVCKKLGMIQEAADDYTQALKLNPSFVDGYVARGMMYYNMNKCKEALQDFREACKLKPDFAKMYVFAGAMHRKIKEFDQALEQLNKAIQLNPNFAEAVFNRGEVYSDLKQYDKAVEDFSKAVTLNPKYIEGYLKRGLVYQITKNFDKAIQDFNVALKLDPKRVEAYDYRGKVFFAKGYVEYHGAQSNNCTH